jgi:hypothetical protein
MEEFNSLNCIFWILYVDVVYTKRYVVITGSGACALIQGGS